MRGRGERRSRSELRSARHAVDRFPSEQPRRAFHPVELLDEERIEAIHVASLRVLEELGIEFMGARARASLAAAGAAVDDETRLVRLPRELVQHCLESAPSLITVGSRNPARTLELGGDRVAFGLVAGPPNVHDRIGGRRPGNLPDYIKLVSLGQSFDVVHFLGNQPTSPIELPANTRHLDCYLANIVYSDRVFHVSAIGRDRALDGIELMAISRGLTLEQAAAQPGVLSVISVNSPRRVDEAMSDGLQAMAEHGQPVVITPFTLMGAMTPVTIGAALVQQNAEALAGLVLAQITRSGAPVVYGAFTSNVDLRSGSPAFGTPENARATMIAGQLARRYGLPYRASNASASNVVDAQAAYESEMSIWSAVLGGAHLVYHGAGWMEGGLTASFEKLVLDVELLQAMALTIAPVDASDRELSEALEALAEVPAGGHFFGSAHTLAHYETAFYRPILSDWRTYESWEAAGARTATERATDVWQRTLDEYEPPPLDDAVREKLEAFVTRRKHELRDADI